MTWISVEVFLALRRRLRQPIRWMATACAVALALVCLSVLSALWWTNGGRSAGGQHVYEVVRQAGTRTTTLFSYPEWSSLEGAPSMALAASAPFHGSVMVEGGVAAKTTGAIYSPRFFELHGVAAWQGQLSASESAADTVVISHRLWRRAFGHDRQAVGGKVRINRSWFSIAAVLPESFVSHVVGFAPDVWVPLTSHPAVVQAPEALRAKLASADLRTVAAYSWLTVRVRPDTGVGADAARAALTSVLGGSGTQLRLDAVDSRALPLALRGFGAGASRVASVVLGLVMLAAIMTVLLSGAQRAAAAFAEAELRYALGAARRHVVGLAVVEHALIWVPAVGLALVASEVVLGTLGRVLPGSMDMLGAPLEPGGFAGQLRIVAAGSAGLLLSVAIDLSQRRRPAASKHAGRRLQAAAIAGEILVCTVLAATTMVFARDLHRVATRPIGFKADALAAVRVNLDFAAVDPSDTPQLFEALERRLREFPEVLAVALASATPLQVPADVFGVGPRSAAVITRTVAVSANYFAVLGQAQVAGGGWSHGQSGASVVLNRTAAARVLDTPGATHEQLGQLVGRVVDDATVVGIVDDARRDDVSTKPEPTEYVPWTGRSKRATLLVRVTDQGAFSRRASELMALAPSGGWIETPVWLADVVAVHQWQQRAGVILSGLCALVTLLFMAVSIQAVVAETITARQRELMIRLALGAPPHRLLARIIGQVAAVALVGAAAGAATAFALATNLTPLLESGGTPTSVVFLSATLCALVAVATTIPPLLRGVRGSTTTLLRLSRA